MKNSNATVAIEKRLKYDWIVLLYGFFCVFVEIFCKGDLGYFLILAGVFVSVEVFGVSLYRKLKNGGEGYHLFAKQTLDQLTSFGFILFCMIFEFSALIVVSMIFWLNILKHCVK